MKIPDSEMNDDYEFGDYLDDVQVREAGEKLTRRTRRKRAKGREAGRGRCGGTGAGSERGGG